MCVCEPFSRISGRRPSRSPASDILRTRKQLQLHSSPSSKSKACLTYNYRGGMANRTYGTHKKPRYLPTSTKQYLVLFTMVPRNSRYILLCSRGGRGHLAKISSLQQKSTNNNKKRYTGTHTASPRTFLAGTNMQMTYSPKETAWTPK